MLFRSPAVDAASGDADVDFGVGAGGSAGEVESVVAGGKFDCVLQRAVFLPAVAVVEATAVRFKTSYED